MSTQIADFVFKLFLFYLPLLFSLCIHEFAHGWTAKKFGDLTAFYQGRLTLNPIAHIDYLGTLALPLFFLLTNSPFFFGWAKPVPVDPGAFQNPKKEMFWVAFAGPLSNIFLAVAGALALVIFYILHSINKLPASQAVFSMVEMMIYVNMLLAIFNLIPLHPLDGGKIIARFLPIKWNIFLESNEKLSYILLIVLVFLGGFHYLAKPILWSSQALISASEWLYLLFSQLWS